MNWKTAWQVFGLSVVTLGTGVYAQDAATGAISGTVADGSGARITGASLTVMSTDIHASRVVKTDGKGQFRVPLLPPGFYSVIVDAPGFAEYKASGIEVVVSETNSLSLSLSIKDSGTTTHVTADTEMAQLESSSLGRVVDETAINSLPLANRNYTQILGLSPGVVVSLDRKSVV